MALLELAQFSFHLHLETKSQFLHKGSNKCTTAWKKWQNTCKTFTIHTALFLPWGVEWSLNFISGLKKRCFYYIIIVTSPTISTDLKKWPNCNDYLYAFNFTYNLVPVVWWTFSTTILRNLLDSMSGMETVHMAKDPMSWSGQNSRTQDSSYKETALH